MPYIHFTEEQKRQANRVGLVEFLRFKGEPLIRSGRELRMERNQSVTIYIPADANGGLCIGRSCADALGAWGPWPPTSCAGYIPGHCLPLLSAPKNKG